VVVLSITSAVLTVISSIEPGDGETPLTWGTVLGVLGIVFGVLVALFLVALAVVWLIARRRLSDEAIALRTELGTAVDEHLTARLAAAPGAW
jgi:hypothetical protein